jgi:hypothetical protein
MLLIYNKFYDFIWEIHHIINIEIINFNTSFILLYFLKYFLTSII